LTNTSRVSINKNTSFYFHFFFSTKNRNKEQKQPSLVQIFYSKINNSKQIIIKYANQKGPIILNKINKQLIHARSCVVIKYDLLQIYNFKQKLYLRFISNNLVNQTYLKLNLKTHLKEIKL